MNEFGNGHHRRGNFKLEVTLAAVSLVHPPAYDCNGSGSTKMDVITILTENISAESCHQSALIEKNGTAGTSGR